MKKSSAIILATAIGCSLTIGPASFAYIIAVDPGSVGPTAGKAGKWEPNANTASLFDPGPAFQDGPGTPGGATWSVMAPNIPITFGDIDDPTTPGIQGGFHTLSDVSSDVGNLVTGVVPDGYEIGVIGQVFDMWAGVSGFTNLGQVNDGGIFNGASDADDGHLGDMRIGAYPFVLDVNTVINAHALFFPVTNAEMMFGSVGGDIHFNDDMNTSFPNQVVWVDDETDVSGDETFDFFTVALHEVGHGLGLAHSDDSTSVMALYNTRGGARRTLSADDIAGIQAIYGPAATAPEPGSLPLMAVAFLAFLGARFRRRAQRPTT